MFKTFNEYRDNEVNPLYDYKDCDYPKDELGNPKDYMAVDQFYSQEFNKAENGFPKSDVSAFLDAQNEDLKAQIASRMSEVKAEYPDQSLSDDVLAKMCIPRNIQSLQQFREWASQIDELGFNKAVDQYIQDHQPKPEASESKIDFSKSDNPEENSIG